MHLGRVIRAERIKAGLSQSELCNGLCSVSHLSKFENGVQHFDDELVALLFQKLNVSLSETMDKYRRLDEELISVYNYIYRNDRLAARKTIGLINRRANEYQNSSLHAKYLLFNLRYYLYTEDMKKSKVLIKKIDKITGELSQYESDLRSHFLGIYYCMNKDYEKSLSYLNSASQNYAETDILFYYALNYYSLGSRVLAYDYTLKALQKFKDDNNLSRIYDTQLFISILLITTEDKHGNTEAIKRLNSLLQSIHTMTDNKSKARLLHNLGYAHDIIQDIEQAKAYYEQALLLKKNNTTFYLNTLLNYTKLLEKTNVSHCDNIETLIADGMQIAKDLKNKRLVILLTMLKYKSAKQSLELIELIENKALPFFRQHNLKKDETDCYKELFTIYKELNMTTKALDMAEKIIY